MIMGKIRVLLADDHKFITEGLKGILEPEYEIVGVVEDGQALVKEAARLQPDIIVVDISMPKLNGIEAVRKIKEDGNEAKVIFLTMHPDVTYASRALEAGGLGFVLKHSAPEELLIAIEKALDNKSFITETIAAELDSTTHSRKDPIRKLTNRQREVLQLLAEGHSAREVGDILFVSPRTVEFHKYKIMEELGIHNSAELVQYAIKLGIVGI
jgi:DNA-binding NarL/FixJ family response regulator